MYKECPICGRPFSVLDVVLLENNIGFQCHNCWNRIRATGPVKAPGIGHDFGAPAVSARRPASAARPRRKKA